MTNINYYCETILATLKEMGKETAKCELVKGGLRCYPEHHKEAFKNNLSISHVQDNGCGIDAKPPKNRGKPANSAAALGPYACAPNGQVVLERLLTAIMSRESRCAKARVGRIHIGMGLPVVLRRTESQQRTKRSIRVTSAIWSFDRIRSFVLGSKEKS
jgi:hypothetical protein